MAEGKGDGVLEEDLGTATLALNLDVILDHEAGVDVILLGEQSMPGFSQVMNRRDARRIMKYLTTVRRHGDTEIAQQSQRHQIVWLIAVLGAVFGMLFVGMLFFGNRVRKPLNHMK